MKNRYEFILLIILLLAIMLAGCTEKPSNSEETNFIGKWNLTVYNMPSDANYIHKLTFCENDTVNNTYWYEGGEVNNLTTTEWLKYELNDDAICLTLTDIEDDSPSCYEYIFSNDFNNVSLSIDGKIILILNKIT